MRKLFFIIAISFTAFVSNAQDFETPVERSSMAFIESNEWSVVPQQPNVRMIKGSSNEMHDYVVEFLEWCGVEYGKKTYNVIASNGMALKVSISEGEQTTWIIVDLGKR